MTLNIPPDLSAYQALSGYDAKGDIQVGTANDTASRKAVGTNGSILVSDSGATHGVSWLLPVSGSTGAQETTTSTSFADLATVGPAATATVGASGMALVILQAGILPNADDAGAIMGFAVSGASTVAATDQMMLDNRGQEYQEASAAFLVTGLTAGSNTFTAKYRSPGGGSVEFVRRRIVVIPF